MNHPVVYALFTLFVLFIGLVLGWAFRGVMDDLKRAKLGEKKARQYQQQVAAQQQMGTSYFADVNKGNVVNRPSRRICPLPECKIVAPHSHTEALIQKMRGG